MSAELLAARRRRRRFNKVSGLTISEVSLVDDPASPGSEVVLYKARGCGGHNVEEKSMTMNTITKALDAAQGGKGRLAKAKAGDTASLADLQADLAEAGPILDEAMQELVTRIRAKEPAISEAEAYQRATATATFGILYSARHAGQPADPGKVEQAKRQDAHLLM